MAAGMAAAEDMTVRELRLLAALGELADEWQRFAAVGDAQDECARELREVITRVLAGQDEGK